MAAPSKAGVPSALAITLLCAHVCVMLWRACAHVRVHARACHGVCLRPVGCARQGTVTYVDSLSQGARLPRPGVAGGERMHPFMPLRCFRILDSMGSHRTLFFGVLQTSQVLPPQDCVQLMYLDSKIETDIKVWCAVVFADKGFPHECVCGVHLGMCWYALVYSGVWAGVGRCGQVWAGVVGGCVGVRVGV
jgi:hypothetical protein